MGINTPHKIVTLPVGKIRLDGGTQMRSEINEDVIEEYALNLDVLPPIVVFHDGKSYWLADGFQRVRAHQISEPPRGSIICNVRPGTQRDAVLYACGANSEHGLRRSSEDKRRAVMTLLKDSEWCAWSNREIARRCAVDEGTVRKYRASLSAEIPQSRQAQASSLPRNPVQESLDDQADDAELMEEIADLPEEDQREIIALARREREERKAGLVTIALKVQPDVVIALDGLVESMRLDRAGVVAALVRDAAEGEF